MLLLLRELDDSTSAEFSLAKVTAEFGIIVVSREHSIRTASSGHLVVQFCQHAWSLITLKHFASSANKRVEELGADRGMSLI